MATSDSALSAEDESRIDSAVAFFERNSDRFDSFAKSVHECLLEDGELADMIHFIRHRVKETESLRRKLRRLASERQGEPINESNLFTRLTDLAGLRIIHLHTDQIKTMHTRILAALGRRRYHIVGRPVAYCWDVEYRSLYESAGLLAEEADSMYTTVHYDIQSSQKNPIMCELQVRSLADEVWGEVSHRVNYPVASPSEACRDQLRVLARLTSGCGRLVDSIFKTDGQARAAGP